MMPLLLFGAFFIAVFLFSTSLKVLREYERAIVFRLGRARSRPLGPGLVLMLPFGVDRAQVVDLRTKVIQIPTQEVITRDNISIGVDAVSIRKRLDIGSIVARASGKLAQLYAQAFRSG